MSDHGVQLHTDVKDSKYQNVQKLQNVFCAFSNLFRKLKLKMFDLENVDEGHRVQLSQCCHTMANIIEYMKVVEYICGLAFTVSEILTFQICNLVIEGQGHGPQILEMEPTDGK